MSALRQTVMLRDRRTGAERRCMVELQIDWPALLRRLGNKALANKSRRSRLGEIVAKIIKEEEPA